MTIFMITHDVREAFALGTRLLVFDRIRHDPQAPERYGATITYQIPLRGPAGASGVQTAAALPLLATPNRLPGRQ